MVGPRGTPGAGAASTSLVRRAAAVDSKVQVWSTLEEICFKRLSMYVLDTFYVLRFPTPGVEFLHEKNINRMLVESHVKPISPRELLRTS